ncbi:hypothetical protein HDV05_008450 [Chytridiales sp. JEL 0842]|nr:hypothetical protein HDV05_008450 [Chytridiales sp. JEL 0842]
MSTTNMQIVPLTTQSRIRQLPVEVWTNIVIYTLSAEQEGGEPLRRLAVLSSVFKPLRMNIWSANSVSIWSSILMNAFGSEENVLAAVVGGDYGVARSALLMTTAPEVSTIYEVDQENMDSDEESEPVLPSSGDSGSCSETELPNTDLDIQRSRTKSSIERLHTSPTTNHATDPRKWLSDSPLNPIHPPALLKHLVLRGASCCFNNGLALRSAVKSGDARLVSLLLDVIKAQHHNVESCVGAADNEAFREACRMGRVDLGRMVLEVGGNVHGRRDEALRFACHLGNEDVVTFLLENGAHAHAFLNDALFNAITMGHVNIVTLLLSNAEMDLGVQRPNGKTALVHAASVGNAPIVKLLLENGVVTAEDRHEAIREAVRSKNAEVQHVLQGLSQ